MASGLRVAQRNELVSTRRDLLRLVSIRSSPPIRKKKHYIRLKASSSKQTCFSNSSTRPLSASTRRWSFFSLSFLRALFSSFFYAEYERKRSLPPGCRRMGGPSTIFLATGIWVRNRLSLDITE